MARRRFYRQCELVSGTTHTVGYIPEDVARRGARLTLDDECSLGGIEWTVAAVGDHRLPEKLVKERQKTDILPSIKATA